MRESYDNCQEDQDSLAFAQALNTVDEGFEAPPKVIHKACNPKIWVLGLEGHLQILGALQVTTRHYRVLQSATVCYRQAQGLLMVTEGHRKEWGSADVTSQ